MRQIPITGQKFPQQRLQLLAEFCAVRRISMHPRSPRGRMVIWLNTTPGIFQQALAYLDANLPED